MRNELWLALGFLTTLPTRMVAYEADGLGRAGRWFPLVGLVVGLILAAVFAVGQAWSTAPVTAVVVVAVWAALTGGLHLDGLADCCDGLLASVARARRIEIMRDPRVGAFGVIGLVLALLLKTTAVLALGTPWPLLLLAPVWARWLILWAARQPPARPGGLGDAFAASLTWARLAQAAVLPIALLLAAGFFDGRSVVAVAGGTLAAYGVVRLARARIGGVTGDVFGAVVEVSEITILLLAAR